MQVLSDSDVRAYICVHPLMCLHWPGHYLVFIMTFSLLFSWDGFIMRFHDVNLFYGALKLDGFAALVATGAGLFVFKWSLRNVPFRVVLENFALF